MKKADLNFRHMLPSLYVQGYTAALQDVLKQLNNTERDIKDFKLRPATKAHKAVVQCMLEHRAIFREFPDAFVRWNCTQKEFEVWIDGAKTEEEVLKRLGVSKREG